MVSIRWVLRQFPFIIGPWIDVFPLDEWNDTDEASQLYDGFHYALWKYRKALSTQSWKEIGYDLIHRNGFNGLIKIVKKCVYSPLKSHYFNQVLRHVNSIRCFKGTKLKAWTEVKKEEFEKEWFSQTIDVSFEDTKIACPILYDNLLKNIYGDYMTLPPLEKRVCKHSLFYCDLNHVKSASEILEELKTQGEMTRSEGKPLSIRVLIDELIHRKGF